MVCGDPSSRVKLAVSAANVYLVFFSDASV